MSHEIGPPKRSQLTWHQLVVADIRASKVEPISSDVIWLASDYSKAAPAQTFSFLIVDGAHAATWLNARSDLRDRTFDEIKYSRIGEVPDRKHEEFVRMANLLRGYLITMHAPNNVIFNLTTRDDIKRLTAAGRLKGCWRPDLLARAAVIARMIQVLCHELTSLTAQLRWVSDNDPIFDTRKRTCDVARILKVGRLAERKKQFDEIDFRKTCEDDGDKFLKDLASIPDLACGAFHDLSLASGAEVKWPQRYALVTSWLARSETDLVKLSYRFASSGNSHVEMNRVEFSSV